MERYNIETNLVAKQSVMDCKRMFAEYPKISEVIQKENENYWHNAAHKWTMKQLQER